MKKIILTSVAMGFLLSGTGSSVHAYFYEYEVDKIGSTHQVVGKGLGALDINDNFLPGFNIISWVFNVETPGQAILSITAEGIDEGEKNEVFFNDTSIGFLKDQAFYDSSFYLNPTIGAALSNPDTGKSITALMTSFFDVSSYILKGPNTVQIRIDTDNWVNQIETSTLTVTPVPEPTTLLLFATGLAGLAAAGRRKRD